MPAEISPLEAQLNDLPVWLSEPLTTLYRKLKEQGEATTAHKTSAVIQALFSFLGRLWVAEYLEAASRDDRIADPAINRELLDRIGAERPIHLGQWVALARQLRERFVTLKRKTVMADLAMVDFGDRGNEDHPVTKLLNFRNYFSHGSFETTVEEIRQNRELLEGLILRLPCLWKQSLVWREAETGIALRAAAGWPEMEEEVDGVPAGQVAVLGEQTVLPLHPLLVVRRQEAVPRPGWGEAGDLHARLKTHEALKVWLAQYERERMGDIEYPFDTVRACPNAVVADLRKALAGPGGLVLVERRPGCIVGGAVDAITPADPLQLGLKRFAALGHVATRPGELGQSGFSVAQMVLRLAEQALCKSEGHYAATFRNLLSRDGLLAQAGKDLKAAKKQVLLGMDGLELGGTAYRDEPLTVRQVYESLAGTGITVVATLVTGVLSRLVFDDCISPPDETGLNADDLRGWIEQLKARSALHSRILDLLAEAAGPMHLFEICDALDRADGGTCFEPEVERALWDLQPLLASKRQEMLMEGAAERVRAWTVFHPAVTAEHRKER